MLSAISSMFDTFHGRPLPKPKVVKIREDVFEVELAKLLTKDSYPNLYLFNFATLVSKISDYESAYIASTFYYVFLAYYLMYEYHCVMFLLSIQLFVYNALIFDRRENRS